MVKYPSQPSQMPQAAAWNTFEEHLRKQRLDANWVSLGFSQEITRNIIYWHSQRSMLLQLTLLELGDSSQLRPAGLQPPVGSMKQ